MKTEGRHSTSTDQCPAHAHPPQLPPQRPGMDKATRFLSLQTHFSMKQWQQPHRRQTFNRSSCGRTGSGMTPSPTLPATPGHGLRVPQARPRRTGKRREGARAVTRASVLPGSPSNARFLLAIRLAALGSRDFPEASSATRHPPLPDPSAVFGLARPWECHARFIPSPIPNQTKARGRQIPPARLLWD